MSAPCFGLGMTALTVGRPKAASQVLARSGYMPPFCFAPILVVQHRHRLS